MYNLFLVSEFFWKFVIVPHFILKHLHNKDVGPIKPLPCKPPHTHTQQTVLTNCTVRTQKVLKALMSRAARVWINAKKWCCPWSCGYASISPDRARNSQCPPTLIYFRGINAESHGWQSEEYQLKMANCASCSYVQIRFLADMTFLWS